MKSIKSIIIKEGNVAQLKIDNVVLWKQNVLDQLDTPTIELNGDILTITTTDKRTEEFVILVDGEEMETVQVKMISGTWYFDENPSTMNLSQTVNFVCSGTNYTNISVLSEGDGYIYYDTTLAWSGAPQIIDQPTGWTNEKYLTITFDGVQIVDKEFYEWFVENASPQVNAPTVIDLGSNTNTIRVIDNNSYGITKSYRIYKLETDELLAEVDRTAAEQDINTSPFSYGKTDAYTVAVAINDDTSDRSDVVSVGSCFVAGTPVLMADNTYKMIEQIQVGDEVKSYNFKTSTYCNGTVTKVATGYTTRIAMVLFQDGNYVAMAEGHPLYTQDGWHSITNENGYPTLAIGDKVLGKSKYVAIQDIQVVDTEPTIVYSLGVTVSNGEDMFDGTYFAGVSMTLATHGGGSA